MKLKKQQSHYDCAVAVCSMVSGLKFKHVREKLSHVKGYGSFMSDITAFLKKQGIMFSESKTLTNRCILRVPIGQQSHFILMWDGFTFDPAVGKSETIPENIQEIISLL